MASPAACASVRVLGHLTAAAAVVYLVFLMGWGFNYRRVPMAQRLVVAAAAPSNDDVVALGLRAVGEMNRLHDEAHRIGWVGDEWRDARLRSAFASVQRALGDAPPAVPGRLKRTLLGPYFRWTGVDGMINPFGLEVLANPDLLPFERPFVAAHEWAHLAGYANEAEANFVGWLTALRADLPAQYSAWLYLFWQVSRRSGREGSGAARRGAGTRAAARCRRDRGTAPARPLADAADGRVGGVPTSTSRPTVWTRASAATARS